MAINLAHWGAFSPRVSNGRIVTVEPFQADPKPSPLVHAIPSAVHAACRIEQPMVRKNWLAKRTASDRSTRGSDDFVPISWDQATELIAEELDRVRSEFGNEAIFNGSAGWASAGCFHHARTQLRRLLNLIGGHTFHKANYSFGAAVTLLPHVVGTTQPLWGPSTDWRSIADNGKLIVCFGGLSPKNVQVESGGIGAHSVLNWLDAAVRNGVEVVAVTPLAQDVPPDLQAQWLAVRPNTDTALLLALAHVILVDGRHDQDFLNRYTTGFQRFRSYLLGETDGQPKTADWAASICGLSADDIQDLARRMAGQRTFITVSWSIQRGDHGEQPYWAAIALAAMLGQIGLPGGGFGFGYGSLHRQGNPTSTFPSPRFPAGSNPVKAFIPAARWSDMLLSPGAQIDFDGERLTYPDIRLLYICGGNPFHHQPDTNKVVSALRCPETIIVHEPWWNPMARMADIVIPATTTLERNDLGRGELDPYLFAMKKAINPLGQSRSDHDVLADVAERLGIRDQFTEGRSEMQWLRSMYDVVRQSASERDCAMPDFDEFWETGHFRYPMSHDAYVEFSDFRSNPDAHPLNTPSGRIEIFSDTVAAFGYDDCPGYPVWIEPSEWLGQDTVSYPLHLISNQPTTRLHSQLDMASVSIASKIAHREPILMHPIDAAERGIMDGDVVRVYNDRGACLAGVRITNEIRPDVVCIATGAWFDPDIPGGIGALDKHGNVNMLTLDKGCSKLSQSPSAQTALVEIEKWTKPLPDVEAHLPPASARMAQKI